MVSQYGRGSTGAVRGGSDRSKDFRWQRRRRPDLDQEVLQDFRPPPRRVALVAGSTTTAALPFVSVGGAEGERVKPVGWSGVIARSARSRCVTLPVRGLSPGFTTAM